MNLLYLKIAFRYLIKNKLYSFINIVGLSLGIAVPVGWYIMKTWLQEFAYRTDLSWWVFAVSACITVFITLVTVSFQSGKAATSNPVDSLRTE